VATAVAVARGIDPPWYRCQSLAIAAMEIDDPKLRLALVNEALTAAEQLGEPNRVVTVASWPVEVLATYGPAERLQGEVRNAGLVRPSHRRGGSRRLESLNIAPRPGDLWGSATGTGPQSLGAAREEHPMQRTLGRVQRVTAGLGLAIAVGALAPAAALAVGTPETFGPFVDSYDFIGFDCGNFQVRIQGSSTTTFVLWFDGEANMTRLEQRTRAPQDVLTNTTTGRSIIVRGEFQEWVTRIPGTDDFNKTITGFRYMVNEPGTGVTIRDVGRIKYADLDQTIVSWEAGEHDLALDEQFTPVFCAALA
jgi:hypothetical protein